MVFSTVFTREYDDDHTNLRAPPPQMPHQEIAPGNSYGPNQRELWWCLSSLEVEALFSGACLDNPTKNGSNPCLLGSLGTTLMIMEYDDHGMTRGQKLELPPKH